MSERPTPETDAEHAQFRMGGFTLDFCRKLERERDEAREALENYKAESIHTCHEQCQRPMCVLRRERDKAQEDAINYYAKIGELINERDDALSQIVQAECRAERFCQERDEARDKYDTLAVENMLEVHKLCQERDEAIENLDEEKKFHHRTHSELVLTQCKVLDLTQAIIATLEENRHLADGDDCTLAKLKSIVPDWE